MEMKDPQTNTAGFSFDADKQSKAEQNRRTKTKKTRLKTRKENPSSQPVDVGGRLKKALERAMFESRASRRGVWESPGCALVHTEALAAGLTSRALVHPR